jgi:hypothetical protein
MAAKPPSTKGFSSVVAAPGVRSMFVRLGSVTTARQRNSLLRSIATRDSISFVKSDTCLTREKVNGEKEQDGEA